MPEPVVLSERHGAILLITLNRPERLNAWTDEMEELYFDTLAAGDADVGVRAMIVTGAGRAFCAGVDMEELQKLGGGEMTYRPPPRPKTFPLSVRKPLIAAVNGPCAGLGLIQALYCDVRFVAQDAKLTTSFSRRGLIAEHGLSWWLPRQIGPGRALDLLLSARVFDGREAVAMGLAQSVAPKDQVLDVAFEYTKDLTTNCSPQAMAITKQLVYAHMELDMEAALEDANTHMTQSLDGGDLAEGVAAFREHRPPAFAPLV